MKSSFYAESAKAAGIDLISWSLERTAPGLKGYYWSSLDSLDLVDGDKMVLLYVLGIEIGVLGVFSDWPATVTFFANCYGLNLHKRRQIFDKVEVNRITRL